MLEFVLKYWTEVGFGLVSTAMGIMYKKIKGYNKEQYAIKLGIQALLRNEIIQIYNRNLDKGYCPIYALENVEAMYKQYTALGGNGAVCELVERIRNMPSSA